MRLTALRLHDVRRFADRGVAIENIAAGVNLLCAANEHGKSTCFDALHALFFTAHTSESAAVQGLRPYSGGHPVVEADMVGSSGRFRIAKRFWSGRRATVTDLASGRIVAQAGEAEAFIAELVRGGAGGPTGLLWVRQGQTGLDRRREDDGEKRARAGILSSVRGEVEALTGGRRMAGIVEACTEELSRLLTPTGRPKAGGAYAVALAERERWLLEERRLDAEVRELRAALDRRRDIRRRLDDIAEPGEERARHERLARAEARLAEGRSRTEARKAAEAEARFAAERHAAAREALGAFRTRTDRAAAVARMTGEAQGARDTLLAARRAARADDEAARAAALSAEAEQAEAKALLTRLDRALRARDAADRRIALETAIARAEEARGEIERLEALLRTLAMPAADLRRLERLEADMAGLRAALAMASASLRIDYDPACASPLDLAGASLRDGEDRALAGSATLDLPGIGRLTLTLPEPAAETRALRAAEDERRPLLARLGVDDLPAAHLREAAARQRGAERDLARQRLDLLAPHGIAALRDEHLRLAPEVPEEGAALDPEAARARLATADETALQARATEREARPRRERLDEEFAAADTALRLAAAEAENLDALLGPPDGRPTRLAGLEQDAATSAATAADARARVAALADDEIDLSNLEAGLRRARSAVEAARTETASLREELAGLSAQIRTRSDEAVEEAFAEARDARAAAETRVAGLEREVAVLQRLQRALDEARVAAREHYFEPILRELRPLLHLVFDDASVTFDDTTLLPHKVRRNGLEEEIGALSGGAREQVAILTRLAFARLLAREGHPTPVILDDALVYSDDDRIERMFDALHRQASDQQIIVFSCRQRAFSRLGGNVLRLAPWTPAT